VQVTGLTKSFGPRTLFANVSSRIGPGDRLAVAGRNGAGRTTLLRILAGLEDADSGSVSIPRGERVALHDQRPGAQAAGTVRGYVEQGLAHARDAEERMATLEAGTALMRAGGYGDLLARRQGDAEGGPEAPAGAGASASRGARSGKGGKAAKAGASGARRPDTAGGRAVAAAAAAGDGASRRSNGRLAREVGRIESRIAGLEAEMAAVEAEVGEAGAAGDVDAVTRLGERHPELQEDLSYALAEREDRAAMLVEGT